MQHILENDQITVTVSTEGAEVQSVRNLTTGQEYIWTADPNVWARHAPVLFPIVGKLKDNQYRLGDDTYQMTQHGFARDQDFKVIEQAANQIKLGLTASSATTEQYPFNFALDIVYQLTDNQLAITYRVINHDSSAMPFSIGGHPGFLCPAQVDGNEESYYLRFEQPETLSRQLLRDGLRTGETRPVLQNEQKLALAPSLFEEDALVFANVASDSVSIVRQSTEQPMVTVRFPGFPYLGIWQKVGADFYCIEPWYGLADSTEASGELTEKEGILTLAPDQVFETTYEMIFY
ncbi:MAG: aldose 1-epimerase family protein [Tunicatimonas sp.]